MKYSSYWIIMLLFGTCSALLPPRLTAPVTADARKPFDVQCNYGTHHDPGQASGKPNQSVFDAQPPPDESSWKSMMEEVPGAKGATHLLGSHEAIQSLKLYAGASEIFRFTPSAVPQSRQFDGGPGGVRVERGRCAGAGCDVRLRAAAGALVLRCELSAEGPTFDIVSSIAELHVIAEPVYGPTIVGAPGVGGGGGGGGGGGEVSAGDVLLLNCSTDLAAPPAHIVWTLDGHQVEEASMSEVVVGPADELGLRKSWRGARLSVPGGAGGTGALHVACVAAQPPPAPPSARTADLLLVRAGGPQISKYTAAADNSAGTVLPVTALTLLSLVLSSQLHHGR